MSFEDFSSSNASRKSMPPSHGEELRTPLLSSAASSKDSSNLERIATNYSKLLSNISEMKQDLAKIGTPQDSENVRNNLKHTRNETQELVKATRSLMALPYDRADRARYDLLANQFSALEAELQKVYAESVRKEKIFLERKAEAMEKRKSTRASLSLNGGGQSLQLQELQQADDIDAKIIAETNKDIQDVEQDLKELVTVFKEVKQLVGEQGEDVNKIEANTQTADMNVVKATQELQEGEKLQNSARKKKFIIAGLTLLCLIIVGLIIFFMVKFWIK